MTTRHKIALKILGVVATMLYGWSFLWYSVMYLYGMIFTPLRHVGLKQPIYFEIFVATLSITIMGVILFKISGHTFLNLLIQNIALVIISFPFFGLITGGFGPFDEPSLFEYTVVLVLTILTINSNDWIKDRRYNRSWESEL